MRRESMLKKEVEQIDNPCFRFSSNSSLLKRIIKKKKLSSSFEKENASKKAWFQYDVKFEGYFHPFNINNGPIKKKYTREKFFDKLFPSLTFTQNQFLQANIIIVIIKI